MTLGVRWVGSPNFSPNRDGHNPNWTEADPNTWIVLHTMVGSFAGANARFQNPAEQASATYGVLLDGSIVQWVKEDDAAWADGTYANNPGSNLDSISIEHEDDGDYNGPRTPQLYEASAQLLADIHRRRGIPLIHRGPGGGVLGHKECNGAQTSCPDGLDVDRIIARANQILNPPPPPPPPDTRPEWLRNATASAGTYLLYESIPVVDMATGQDVPGKVVAATLVTAYKTTAGGVAYELTQYSHDHLEGYGFRVSDIEAAIKPPAPPAPVYVARSGDTVISSGMDEAAVLAAAQAWLDAHRGSGAEILKDGTRIQTLDPIPPAPPQPEPEPTPVPQPPPPPPSAPASWEEWLVGLADREIIALIELFRDHLGRRQQP